MLKSISKKVGAVVLSAAMALSLAAVAPVSADAATAYTMTNKAGQEVEIGAASTYYVKGVKSTQYVKVVPRGEAKSGITVKHAGKLIKATQMVKGTKNGTFGIVTTADESVAGKQYNVWVYIYNSKTATKPVKTLKGGAVTVKEEKVPVTAVQSGTKKITVTGKDLKADKISVKKGANAVSSTVEVAADGKSAVITLASTLVADSVYTVTVDTETVDVKAEAGKVASIEITSDKLILDAGEAFPTDGSCNATAAYVVKNQWGEDLTKTTTVTCGGTYTASNGKINYTVPAGLAANAQLPVVLIYAPTNVSATKTLALSNAVSVSAVAVDGVYAYSIAKQTLEAATITEGKAPATGTNTYLVVDVKDQYGSSITTAAVANAGIIIYPTTGLINGLTVATGFTEINLSDGSKKLGIAITGTPDKSGVVNATIIATSNGASAIATINVAESAHVYDVQLANPDLAIAGEAIKVPFTATDKEGNVVTNIDVLKADLVLNAGQIKVDSKTKETYVEIPAQAKGYFSLTATNNVTKAVKFLSINVKDAAVATSIAGLEAKYETASIGTSATLKLENLVLVDQYDRKYTNETAGKNGLKTKAAIMANRSITASEDTTVLSLSATDIDDAADVLTITKDAAGTGKIELSLNDTTTTTKVIDTFGFTFRFATDAEYVSYKVDEISTMYAGGGAAYDKEVKVYGVLNDGKAIKLAQAGNYLVEVIAKDKATVAGDVLSANTIVQASKLGVVAGTNQNKDGVITVKVTINATGEVFTQDVAISSVTPKTATLKLVAADTADAAAAKTADAVATVEKTLAELGTPITANTLVKLYAVDQYGVDTLVPGSSAKYTITAGKAGTYAFTGNGTNAATIAKTTTTAAGNEATVTVAYDGATATFAIIAQ